LKASVVPMSGFGAPALTATPTPARAKSTRLSTTLPCLAIVEMALGPNHPRVAVSLNNLGSLNENQGRDADAEPLYRVGAR